MKPIIFALPGNEDLAEKLVVRLDAELGQVIIRRFPDGESYVRVDSEVRARSVLVVSTMHRPDDKILPLYFLSRTIRSLGAEKIVLIAPYLAYMRQDTRFRPGEGITSKHFGALISQIADGLVTVDPHLHRHSSLSEIYHIPTRVVHAAGHISEWIRKNVEDPVLIGPDSESEQWVSEVADDVGAPYFVLKKIRRGDREVEITLPPVEAFKGQTPVLVDDIISTGRTFIETVEQLRKADFKPPVCVGVHAVFSGSAYEDLKKSGVRDIVTCNTIMHETNKIDVSDLLVAGWTKLT